MSERDIVCIATTLDSARAYDWRNALEAAGIECQVGDRLPCWIDNAPGTQADVWVNRGDAHLALEVLANHDAGSRLLAAV